MAKGKHKDKKASTTAKSKDTKDEAKQKNKREQREEAKVAVFNPYAAIDNELDASEKRFGLSAMAIDKREPRFSTGLLSVDVILAGGFVGGGWYTSAGGEQSAKSTFVMTVLASIMKQVFMSDEASPIKAALFDYEGSTGSAGEYLENIMRSMGVKTDVERIFGVQDEETGKWLVTPKIRYYQPDTGERFFDYVAKLEKLLPDKVRVGENWYYVYENTKDNQKMLKGFYDTAYFSKHNKFRVPAKDGSIQALIITDSYPCMNPGRSEEKEEGDQSLALQARMFSDGIKRIKGKLRKKRIVILGINQLRKIPMAMYGPTEDEPCGESLKFNSDVRFRMASCALSAVGAKGQSNIEEEESVLTNGFDKYRYVKMTTHKNKMGGIPKQSIFLRLVVENAKGDATGFCRTWDCFQYMKLTGQIEGNRKKIKFMPGFSYSDSDGKRKDVDFKSPFAGKVISWMDFKALVEADKATVAKLCKAMKMPKPVMLRSFLEKQVHTGQGYAYLKANKRAQNQAEKVKGSAVTDDDDD